MTAPWHPLRLLAGGAAWVAAFAWLRPPPLEAAWGYALLLFAPLVLVPVGLRLAEPLEWPGRLADRLQLPAALALAYAFTLPAGDVAKWWSVPWLAVTALVGLEGVRRIALRGLKPLDELSGDAGLAFLFVGGLWATASRAGMRPMGFDDTVVLLTANHFHYAGFVVPIVAGLCARQLPGRVSRATLIGVLAGVPLVAAGITATKYEYAPVVECAAALVMAASGVGVAWLHLRLAANPGPTPVRLAWAVAGASLLVGMTLAALYGVRFFTRSDEVLTIPWMRAVHGSINVFGFALASFAGWSARGGEALRTGS